MKTILYVLQYEIIGGPHLRILLTASRLVEKYRAIIILPRGGNAVERFREAGITTYEIRLERLRDTLNPLKHLKYLLYFFPVVIEILQIIKKESVNLIVSNNVMLLQAPIAAKLARIKLVWHLEEMNVPLWSRNIFSLIVRTLSDQIIVVSKAVQRFFYLQSSFLSKRVAIIHAPVDPYVFRPDISPDGIRAEFGISKTTSVIGMVGNINPIKGHKYFLKAAAIIKQKHPDSKFLVVGPKLPNRESYFESLQILCDELGLTEYVIFTGGRQDIPIIMAALDVLVLSSLSEACPMVVLEAMATGKPVVAARVGGVPEEIVDGQTGILVPPEDAEAIAEAVLYLLKHPRQAKEMGVKGRERIIQHFSLEKSVEQHKDLYLRVLKKQ
jgi:glycosyltransferase involved in cell wall biosynthesis